MEDIKLINGDCLVEMKNIPDKSVDMILCDLPYGTTAAKWDSVIPFEPLWEQYKRVIKDNGAILLFGTEPFSSYLRVSNIKQYRYDYIWKKSRYSNFYFVKKQTAKKHEIISVFYKKQPTYNPQMEKGTPYVDKRVKKDRHSDLIQTSLSKIDIDNKGTRYPSTILDYPNSNNNNFHPTQKPINLLEHLIETYSNEGDTILDNTMGSGSTMVACVNTNRKGIGIELDKSYFDIATNRVNEAIKNKKESLF